MLATLIPLFDETLAVSGYSLFSQKRNKFEEISMSGTGVYDGVGTIEGFDIINTVGMGVVSEGNPIFVSVNGVSVFTDINEQCKVPHDKIVILLDRTIKPEKQYIDRVKEIKASGYKLCIRKLEIPDFEPYREIISLMDYIILDNKKVANIDAAKKYFGSVYPDLLLVAGNVDTIDIFEGLVEKGGYTLYEGNFYRLPVTKGETEVSPLKINYIELLNVVNKPDFDLTEAADVIGRDTALVIDLLKMVNRIAINSEITSIRHAAAMLGQRELKKWINTAVAHQLCADRPNEITRLSLIRAKFLENLAPHFDLSAKASELFLTGLFSVIDIILNLPMKEALDMVYLPKEIIDALTTDSGVMHDVLEFAKQYEIANFSEVSRVIVVNEIDTNGVYDAYVDALKWYAKMFAK